MNKKMRATNWERDETLVVQIVLDSFEVGEEYKVREKIILGKHLGENI